MIINETEAVRRLNSPMNLMNKLAELKQPSVKTIAKRDAMSLFGIGRKTATETATETEIHRVQDSHKADIVEKTLQSLQPSQPIESLDNILEDHDAQIKLGLAHDRALDLLNRSVAVLSEKLDEVKAERLPSVISAASKTVESIRRERLEASKHGEERAVHFHFYTPEQHKVSDYEIIDVQ